ncbi:MAG: twin-arginine translocase subunit TatC [Anaerolineales bacterium]|jgi:sec-independent protein translocase protein TatC
MRKFLRAVQRILLAPFRLIFSLLRGIARWFTNTIQRINNFFTEEPEDSPLPDAFAKSVENPMGVLEHLDALRKHLLRAVVFMAVTTAFAFVFARQIIDLLASPIGGIAGLNPIDITEPIGVFMRVSLLVGFALALPYIALELWMFAAPGLSRRSRIWGLLAIPAVAVFFVAGMSFAYFIMLPAAIPFLLNFLGMTPQIRPSSYIGFTTGLMFWVGVAFEFPLVIFVLAGMGLVKADTLAKQWRLAIVAIAVISAAITPTIDPVNMALVMGPMILLYFFSIGLASIAQRGRSTA